MEAIQAISADPVKVASDGCVLACFTFLSAMGQAQVFGYEDETMFGERMGCVLTASADRRVRSSSSCSWAPLVGCWEMSFRCTLPF